MKVLAISKKGAEFLYNARSARKVSERSAETICKICNENGYLLKDGDTWYIHEVDSYDNAYVYAQHQRFSIRGGIVSDCKY